MPIKNLSLYPSSQRTLWDICLQNYSKISEDVGLKNQFWSNEKCEKSGYNSSAAAGWVAEGKGVD